MGCIFNEAVPQLPSMLGAHESRLGLPALVCVVIDVAIIAVQVASRCDFDDKRGGRLQHRQIVADAVRVAVALSLFARPTGTRCWLAANSEPAFALLSERSYVVISDSNHRWRYAECRISDAREVSKAGCAFTAHGHLCLVMSEEAISEVRIEVR